MTLPMGLTLARIGLVPAFLTLVVLGRRWPAVALFAGMAATDRLDGSLARRRGQVTRLGTLLDPVADKLLVSLSLVLLAVPRFAPGGFAIWWSVPLGVFLKDLGVVIGVAVVARKNGRVEIHASRPGKLSTTIQLALVLATLLALIWNPARPAAAASVLWSLWWATIWAAAAAAVDYSREGARQLRAAGAVSARRAAVPPPPGGWPAA